VKIEYFQFNHTLTHAHPQVPRSIGNMWDTLITFEKLDTSDYIYSVNSCLKQI